MTNRRKKPGDWVVTLRTGIREYRLRFESHTLDSVKACVEGYARFCVHDCEWTIAGTKTNNNTITTQGQWKRRARQEQAAPKVYLSTV